MSALVQSLHPGQVEQFKYFEQAKAGHPKDIPDTNGHFCKVLSFSLPTKLERTEISVSTVLGLRLDDPCSANRAAVFCSS